jgi:hypothetical protein
MVTAGSAARAAFIVKPASGTNSNARSRFRAEKLRVVAAMSSLQA